jgi:hypothetical protein
MDIQEVFEDRKGVIRGRTLKNDRQKELLVRPSSVYEP